MLNVSTRRNWQHFPLKVEQITLILVTHRSAGVLVRLTLEEAGKRWNDAELAAQNPITALQTKRDESGLLHSIRARWESDFSLSSL